MDRVPDGEEQHSDAYVLVVDDDKDVARLLHRVLSTSGYQVVCAHDGASALGQVRSHRFDLVLLDVNMPKIDGFQVCLRLRAEPEFSEVPVLFLTGRDTLEDRLLGFEVGCDDYLVKPFEPEELLARVKALLRRSLVREPDQPEAAEPSTRLQVGSLALDLRRRQAHCPIKTVPLTPAEFDLLKFFMEHPNEVHSAQVLLREVWDYPEDSTDTGVVRWHIKNLRNKIEPDPLHPTYIHTVPRQGYILEEP